MQVLIGITILFLSALVACNKKDNNSNNNVAPSYPTAYGSGSTIRGVVNISPECQANVATISLGDSYSGNTSVGGGYYNSQVPTGGSFDIQVNPGQYTLTAIAGQCRVSGPVVTSSYDVQPYTVCLGPQCTGYSPYNGSRYGGSSPCYWSYVGCQGKVYPGQGNMTLQNAKIFFHVKEATSLQLNFRLASSVNLLLTQPAWSQNSGWSVAVSPQGEITSESSQQVTYSALVYSARLQSQDLQWTSGFCDKKEKISDHLQNYMKAYAYTDKAQQALLADWTAYVPVLQSAEVCVYPQDTQSIKEAIVYESTQSLSLRRLWFIVIPYVATAKNKAPADKNSVLALTFKKPAQMAFAVTPKQNPASQAQGSQPSLAMTQPVVSKQGDSPSKAPARQVATEVSTSSSAPSIVAEEIALGFIVE